MSRYRADLKTALDMSATATKIAKGCYKRGLKERKKAVAIWDDRGRMEERNDFTFISRWWVHAAKYWDWQAQLYAQEAAIIREDAVALGYQHFPGLKGSVKEAWCKNIILPIIIPKQLGSNVEFEKFLPWAGWPGDWWWSPRAMDEIRNYTYRDDWHFFTGPTGKVDLDLAIKIIGE